MVQIGKWFVNFTLFAKNDGLFGYLRGVHGFLTVGMCANGADFMSFII